LQEAEEIASDQLVKREGADVWVHSDVGLFIAQQMGAKYGMLVSKLLRDHQTTEMQQQIDHLQNKLKHTGFVYRILFEDGEMYIGETINSIQKRYAQHMSISKFAN
jgi:tRNA G10  N-methylase Trm11